MMMLYSFAYINQMKQPIGNLGGCKFQKERDYSSALVLHSFSQKNQTQLTPLWTSASPFVYVMNSLCGVKPTTLFSLCVNISSNTNCQSFSSSCKLFFFMTIVFSLRLGQKKYSTHTIVGKKQAAALSTKNRMNSIILGNKT